MIPRSSIGWTDYSGGDANFIIGCTPASEGCRNCYARAWAQHYNRNFGEVVLYPDKLRRLAKFSPVGASKRGEFAKCTVFVGDLSDLFHSDIPESFLCEALDVMAGNSAVDWQVLTKRPERALSVLDSWGALPDHVWMGATCENQARLDERLPILRQVNAAIRWLSIEPMLGPVTIPDFDGLSWVVVGAESGPDRRSFDASWARSVRDACRRADVPFFYKQGSGARPGTDPYLDGQKWQAWPITAGMVEQLAFA